MNYKEGREPIANSSTWYKSKL